MKSIRLDPSTYVHVFVHELKPSLEEQILSYELEPGPPSYTQLAEELLDALDGHECVSLLWGEKGSERLSKTVLKTPTGRYISESKSRKMFIKAIDTARYFTFKKMTLEEILERTQSINE